MEDVPVGCATCRFSFELHCDASVARQSLFCVDGCVSELFEFILSFFFVSSIILILYVSVRIQLIFGFFLIWFFFSVVKLV